MFSFLQFYISFLYTQKKPRFTIFGLMERKKQTIVQLWGASPWCDVCVRGGSHLATLVSLTLIQGARRGGNLPVPHPHASSPILQCSRGIHMLEVRSYRACAQYAYFPTICIARVHDPSVPNTVVCLCVKLSDASVATPHTLPKIHGPLDNKNMWKPRN